MAGPLSVAVEVAVPSPDHGVQVEPVSEDRCKPSASTVARQCDGPLGSDVLSPVDRSLTWSPLVAYTCVSLRSAAC